MLANKKIDLALNRLTKWSEKPQWMDYVSQIYFDYCDFVLIEFDILEDELLELLDHETKVSMNSAIFEDFFTNWYGPNGELNVINDYLKRRGSREPPIARQYLKALLDSSVSIYEVVEHDPKGHTMKVQDMLQEDLTLTIQTGSDMDNWVVWDCLGARVVSMSGKLYFTDGTLKLSRALSNDLVNSIHRIARSVERRMSKRMRLVNRNPSELPTISRDALYAAAPIASLLIQSWLVESISTATAPMMELHNADDENIKICEVRFPILVDQAEVVAALDEIEELERSQEESTWRWIEYRSPTYKIVHQPKGSVESKKMSTFNESVIDNILIGFVKIRSESVVLSVNSAERADRGKNFLGSCLGNLVGQSLTSYQSFESMLKEGIDLTNDAGPIRNEETFAIEQAYLLENYTRVLDQPIPMLGGKTPRKAATTKRGRGEIVEWLKTLENCERRRAQMSGQEPFDMTWMWEELNIDAPR